MNSPILDSANGPEFEFWWFAVGDGKAYSVYTAVSEKAIAVAARDLFVSMVKDDWWGCLQFEGIGYLRRWPLDSVVAGEGSGDWEAFVNAAEGCCALCQVREDGALRSMDSWVSDGTANGPDSWNWDGEEWRFES